MSKEQYAIKTFEDVLHGTKSRYHNFWIGEEGRINSALIIRYIIEEKLKLKQHDILPTFTKKFLKDFKLGGMLELVHNENLTDCLLNAYPNFKPHCRSCKTPYSFTDIDNYYCSNKCKEHWKYENKIKDKRAKNESKEMCIYCGIYKAMPETKYCKTCAESFKNRNTKTRQEALPVLINK